MTKEVDERVKEGVLRCFVHVERMENHGIAKRVYLEEFVDASNPEIVGSCAHRN